MACQAAADCERLHKKLHRLVGRTLSREVEWGFDHSFGLSKVEWQRVMRLQDKLRAARSALEAACER
jgi:hypothetical protein